MIYKVQLTDEARQDLRDIYEYIAFTLIEPGIAKKLYHRIVGELKTLREMPTRYMLYQDAPWKSRGFRRMNIGNYCVLYVVAEHAVQVMRILYGGREISDALRDSNQTAE
jgi:toxin ParE1/3/4